MIVSETGSDTRIATRQISKDIEQSDFRKKSQQIRLLPKSNLKLGVCINASLFSDLADKQMMTFNIAKERPFHRQLNFNNLLAVLAIAGIPAFEGEGAHYTSMHIFYIVITAVGWWVLVSVKSEASYRIASHFSMLVTTLGLRFNLDTSFVCVYWRAFTAAVVIMAAAILFVRVVDYTLGVLVAISGFFAGVSSTYFNTIGYLNFVIGMSCVASVGCMMNIIIMSAYRNVYGAREKYRKLSRIDPLTGLLNRRAFMDRLHEADVNCAANRPYVAIIDIDHFKQINDAHGHDIGDSVLVAFAECLKRHCSEDNVARLGGEEFGLLLYQQGKLSPLSQLESLLNEVLETEVSGVKFTFSAGIARPLVGGDVRLQLQLRYADAALYRAKKQGRNQIVLADEAINPS